MPWADVLGENFGGLNRGEDFLSEKESRGLHGGGMQFFDQMPPCVFPVVTIYNVTKRRLQHVTVYKQDCRPDVWENFSPVDLFFPIFSIDFRSSRFRYFFIINFVRWTHAIYSNRSLRPYLYTSKFEDTFRMNQLDR